MRISGCGLAAPSIDEGLVDRAVDCSTIWGKGVGRGQ